jgi:hypothetical protein
MEQVGTLAEQILEAIEDLSQRISALSVQSLSEDLELRDYALGMLAELGEARARLLHSETTAESLTEKLRLEMTRAYEAELEVVRLTNLLAREMTRAAEAESNLNAVRASFTWKLGRFFMLPIRAIRRLVR